MPFAGGAGFSGFTVAVGRFRFSRHAGGCGIG